MSVLTSVCSELRIKCVLIWSFMNECLFVCMHYVCFDARNESVCYYSNSTCTVVKPYIYQKHHLCVHNPCTLTSQGTTSCTLGYTEHNGENMYNKEHGMEWNGIWNGTASVECHEHSPV